MTVDAAGSGSYSSPSASYLLSPNYSGVKINGTTYTPPTTTYTKDAKGNLVATTTPGSGMQGLTGQNTTGKSQTEFDGETFLKLLVTQLKYQDPSKPMDSSQIMQQSATLSMVEQINNMVKANDKTQATYTSMLAEQRISSAVAIVGRTVQYMADPNDPTKTAEGVVDSVKFDGTGPILSVGGKSVPYQDVTQVMAAASATTTGTTGAATGTTSGTTGSSTTSTSSTGSSSSPA